MADAYRNMIVLDAQAALARTITETLAPIGGRGMYTTGLSSDGTGPATLWISSGLIDADYAALLPLLEWVLDEDGVWQKTVISLGHPEIIVQMCAEAQLEVTLAEVEELLNTADVTLETPQQSWSRLGVQLVQPEEENEV